MTETVADVAVPATSAACPLWSARVLRDASAVQSRIRACSNGGSYTMYVYSHEKVGVFPVLLSSSIFVACRAPLLCASIGSAVSL